MPHPSGRTDGLGDLSFGVGRWKARETVRSNLGENDKRQAEQAHRLRRDRRHDEKARSADISPQRASGFDHLCICLADQHDICRLDAW